MLLLLADPKSSVDPKLMDAYGKEFAQFTLYKFEHI